MPLPNYIQTAKYVYRYAYDVIKGRFPEGETIIATDPEYAYYYACNVIKGRFPEGESTIATDSRWAYLYARDVTKGRWLDGELHILFSKYATDYAELCGMPI